MQMVKIIFDLEVDDEGFPPISAERLNGVIKKNGTIKIDNSPFFAEGIALGDIIKVRGYNDCGGNLFGFSEVVIPSYNMSLSIIILDDSCSEEIYQWLIDKGCYCEYGKFPGFNMIAVSVKRQLVYSDISSYLDDWEEKDCISYAELCVY